MSDTSPAALRHTGGDAIARSLRAHGVDTVFGLPGAQVYGLFDAFGRTPGLRVIAPRHEQACAYMALGYARATGREGVCAVVPGPGILNASAGLLTAFGCNERVLALTGEVPSAFLGQGRGHLHEMPAQLATIRGFTKDALRIDHPADASRTVATAFRTMRSGRPGPVAVEMPWDQFGETTTAPVTEPLPPDAPPPPDPDAIGRAVRLIREAAAPMILVGGGATHAAGAVLALAERLGAPVTAFRSGRGILPDEHPLATNVASGQRLWDGTDLVIAIGTRMELPGWRWQARTVRQIRIEIDPAEMRRSRPDAAVLADAAEGAQALVDALGAGRTDGRRGAVRAARDAVVQAMQSVQPQVDYLTAMRAALPRDALLVDELTQTGFASWFAWPVHAPRTFITTGYQGTLGYGFPTALGAKVALPDRVVVSITGDGGFMFGVQELATAAQYGIGVITLVFNNGAYGNVRRDQQALYRGRTVGSELRNPDFVRLAQSFGVGAQRIAGPAEMGPALGRAMADGGPQVIEVVVPRDSEASPWPFIIYR